ncbi:MAG: double zinc ribbon domain-containing protein [Gemmatimonadaceae bacterium]
MTSPDPSATPCPRCKAPATGRFCAECGAALAGATCAACAEPLAAGARFCHHCGAAAGVAAPTVRSALPWIVPGIAVMALVAFLIGQRVARGNAASAPPDVSAAPAGMRAPDISSMSPEERASRLFDLVMRFGEEGKTDSLKFFAPMAIQAYEMVGPLDAHARYDIGMIGVVSGDVGLARAEADTILATNRTHLLGLVLAMKAAGLRQDMKARAGYLKRLEAAAPAERAKHLKEYEEHNADIDAALKPIGDTKP